MSSGSAPDPRHWTTADGHRYTSIPTVVPAEWKQKHADTGLTYVSGDYTIVRLQYGATGFVYDLYRDDVVLVLAFYSRLKDAKERAVQNAEGRDVVNVA